MKKQKTSIDLRRCLAVLLLALAPAAAQAQFYSFGTEPSGVSWRQIRSEHFKLIYPEETDSLARSYLVTLEKMRPLVNAQMRIETPTVPVILHAYTTLSNGSVSWAPKQVNLVLSPDPYDCSQYPWQEQLVTHELRHVAQIQHYAGGLWRALYWGLGEQSTGLAMGLLTPRRQLEGDAVIAETELTATGRGRSAAFFQQIRTDYLSGVFFNWERSALGSFQRKSYDLYALGYLLETAERLRTGDADYMGRFFAHRAALGDVTDLFKPREKRYALSNVENLSYTQTLFRTMWEEDAARRGEPTLGWRLSPKQRLYCDYWGAVQVTDSLSPLYGSLLVLRKGMHFTDELMQIDTLGRERHIRYHPSYSSKLSEAPDGRVYWSEPVMHDPSSLENFSEIKYYDTRADRLGTLTRSTKYFNPAISDDATTLAVAEYPVGGVSHLVLLSPEDGSVLSRVEAPGKGQIFETMFVGEWLYVTVATGEGLSLLRIRYAELETGTWHTVIAPQRASISGLRHLRGQWICFASDYDGVLNIYALHPSSEQVYRLTNSRFGANHPFLDDNHQELYFSEYDRDGYYLCSMHFRELRWEKVDFAVRPANPLLEQLLFQSKEGETAATAPENQDYLDPEKYPSKPYNKLLNAFHIHSWAPFYYDVDHLRSFSFDHWWEAAAPGFTLYSQNELGDVVTKLGYSWMGFSSGHAKVTATVKDFDLELAAELNAPKLTSESSSFWPRHEVRPYHSVSLTLDYPFNLFGGGWYSMLIPTLGGSFTRSVGDAAGWDRRLEAGLRYYSLLPVAKAAIYPRWGYSLTARTVLGYADAGAHLASSLSGYTYFPGVLRGQGLKLSLAAQHRFSAPLPLYDDGQSLSLPRGYDGVALGKNFVTGSLDYAIPVPLGDRAVPGILYFKRLQVIPFGDYAADWADDGSRRDYWSTGASLLVDFNLLCLAPNLTAGVRWSFTADQGPDIRRHHWRFLFGIAL